MDEIPRSVDTAVRAEASRAGGYSGSLDIVYLRVRRRRRRHVAGAFAAVVAVLAVAGAGALFRPAPRPAPLVVPPVAPTTPPVSLAPAAQPLLLADAAGTYHLPNGPTVTLGGDSRVGELIPQEGVPGGFTLVTHQVVGADSWDRSVAWPDGWIVALGPHDLAPGKNRPDGVNVTDLEINLVVLRRDGHVELKRNVRRAGEGVALLTADRAAAYLWRPAGLVMHSLASGAEHVEFTPQQLGVPGTLDGSIAAADLVRHQLVVSRAAAPCSLLRLTGGVSATLPVRGVGCASVNALRLSPDAGRVAVVYQTAGLATGVAVLSTADGTVLANQEIPPIDGAKMSASANVAWQDDTTLIGAAYPVGDDGTQVIAPLRITMK
ncbi:hypothetical protein [Actinoplanes sp. NPDC026619]|uniref:hypothetical protein n=1 Tax=Actinoplanes sp. NPDC026619 TaxID=3155798 RepID=UPI0033FE801C